MKGSKRNSVERTRESLLARVHCLSTYNKKQKQKQIDFPNRSNILSGIELKSKKIYFQQNETRDKINNYTYVHIFDKILGT